MVVFVVRIPAPVGEAPTPVAAVGDEAEVERADAEDDGREVGEHGEEVAEDDAEPVARGGNLFEDAATGGSRSSPALVRTMARKQFQPQPRPEPAARAEPVFEPGERPANDFGPALDPRIGE